MKWEEYEKNFIGLAKLNDKSEEYCIKYLEYAKILFKNKVPIIYNQEHLSRLVGYKSDYLYSASNQSYSFYRSFTIKKKNGKDRFISEPLPSLKEIQNWILEEILYKIDISPYAKAYVKNKSIKENARFHKKQVMVLTMDIKDFFSSIKFGNILHIFTQLGYEKSIAVMLANLCCLNGVLPQGAPTSPALSNIVFSKIDYKIANYIKPYNIRYTRYADDLTFSGDFNAGDLIKGVERLINSNGLLINENKTRIRRQNQRQEVTGIVVNQKMQLEKKIRKRIRSDVYYIKKYGIDSHLERTSEKRKNYLYHMIGLATYALFINPKDCKMREYLEILKDNLVHQQNEAI